jgi:hypothetical protein
VVDLLRLLVVLDALGHDQGLSRGTVSDYLTSTKHHYTVDRQFVDGTPASVWGSKGHNHPLVTMMLKSIPVRHRAIKRLLSPAWIKDGFDRCWNPLEYVAIAFLLGWILRVGEGCDMTSAHHITWSMVHFSIQTNDVWGPLPMTQLRTRPCDMVELKQQSRKYQEEPRLMPGRINMCHLDDPSLGATTWCHLCMPTLLQGWAIMNDVDHLSATQLASRPVLAPPGSDRAITRSEVSAALRRLARLRHEDEDTVTPHCLRKTGITLLANSSAIENMDRFLRTVGHHHIQSSEPYIVPDHSAAAAVSTIFHQHATGL